MVLLVVVLAGGCYGGTLDEDGLESEMEAWFDQRLEGNEEVQDVNCEVWDDSDNVVVVYDCTIMFINGASARRRVAVEGDDWRLL